MHPSGVPRRERRRSPCSSAGTCPSSTWTARASTPSIATGARCCHHGPVTPSRRQVLTALVPVLLVGTLLTTVGIQDRFQTARERLGTPVVVRGLPARFHAGPPPCHRYLDLDSVTTTETSSAARALIRGGFVRWMPEVLALTWAWTEAHESAAHARTADAEHVEVVLEVLSPIDRFWLRTVGRGRLAELTESSTTARALVARRAEEAAAQMPPELQARLRALWLAHPRVLSRPAEVGLVNALVREAPAE